MMRLEHVNIVVKNIQTSLIFYQAAFHEWGVRDSGESEWYGVKRNWCHFGDDISYLTFNDDASSEARDNQGHQAGISHLGFETSDIEALKERLAEAGFTPHSWGNENPFRHNVYFNDPDGVEVEFVQYFSDNISERNSTV